MTESRRTLAIAATATAVAVPCWSLGWLIPAYLATLTAATMLAAWVAAEYEIRAARGELPRWLATAELFREYLASEDGPEGRRRADRNGECRPPPSGS